MGAVRNSGTRQNLFRGEEFGIPASPSGRVILGLTAQVALATRIAKAAKLCHMAVHNADKAEPLLAVWRQAKVSLVLIDWDECEREGFALLAALRQDPGSRKLPVMGFVSQKKADLKPLAQRAGCDRVLTKTDFLTNLEDLIARCAV